MRLQGKGRGARAGFRRQALSAHPLLRAIAAGTLACAVCVFIPGAMAHPAWGIVVDLSGQIYFSDLETIWKIDRAGRLSIARSGVSGRHVHELALDPRGHIRGQDFAYAPDTGRYREAIWELAPNGKITWALAPTESRPRGRSLWSDPDGTTYAVDQNDNTRQQTRILERRGDGRVAVLAGDTYGHRDGTRAGAKLENIVGITFGPDHALYVTDNSTVRRVSFHGVVTTLAANFDDVTKLSARVTGGSTAATSGSSPGNIVTPERIEFGELMGIAITASRDIYVADFRNRRIVKVGRAGRKSIVLTADPPWSPTGVALGPDGAVYALEVGFRPPGTWIKPRVRRVSRDGRVTLLATVPN